MMAKAASKGFAVPWKLLERWDVKFFTARVRSHFPIVRLAPYINEHNERIKPFDFPDQTFRILGVTNTGGIFHAYDCLGKEINQPYQKVDAEDFAYNPYRVNVGSIGLVPKELGGNYISPAYVVFSTDKSQLLPEYLLLILKSDWYNPILRAATAGSVRQNLTYDLLGSLEIPLPALEQQMEIVERAHNAQQKVAAANHRIKRAQELLGTRFLSDLGIDGPSEAKRPKGFAVNWKTLFGWSVRGTFLSLVNSSLRVGRYPVVQGTDCLADVRHGSSASPSLKPTSLEVLKISAVTRGTFNPAERKFAVESIRVRSEFNLTKGDVLMCRTNGTLAYVGMSAFVSDDMQNLVFPDKLIRVRCKANILPEFLWQVLQSYPLRAQIEAAARTAVGNYAIGTEDIWRLNIPLPPLPAQKKIMERVASTRAEIERERNVAESLAKQTAGEIESLILGRAAA